MAPGCTSIPDSTRSTPHRSATTSSSSSPATGQETESSTTSCAVPREARLPEHDVKGRIQAFKNNTDSAGNSYGCHENYLVLRSTPFPRLVEALIPSS